MRGKLKSRYSPRVSKRKKEKEISSISEPKPKRTAKKNDSEQKVDRYCWLCHTEANDNICVICHRAYHNSCLDKASASFSELGVCPECQFKSVDGTELNSNRFFSLDKLKKMLDVLTRRSFDKKREKNEIFLGWPEEDRDNLFKIIDFEILLDNINHVLPYTRTAEFYGDVKFIYHNSCIAYGANSDQAKAAENLRRDFKTELLDLEACPECYYYLYCDENDSQDPFVRLCDSPHDIVWAQLTGHPYWPAKCLKVIKGIAHVRFFGEHEQSNIPISKCFFLSASHPKDKNSKLHSLTNSGPKSQRYKCAKSELLEYIQLYRRKYGDFPFYPHRTSYKPHEKQNEVVILSTEGSCNRNLVQMKLEGNVNEDSEMYIINTSRVVDSEDSLTFQNSVTNDIPAPNDNLNKNPSVVTSINMTFSTDENNFNIENSNAVVTSIGSLPPTDTASNVLSSSAATDLLCSRKNLEKYKNIFDHSGPRGAETIHSTIVTNNTLSDSRIQSDSLRNIMKEFPIYTGNHTELDDEVHYIGQERDMEDGEFNPDFVLPVLMETNPELRSLVQKTRYISDAMIVSLYASLGKNSNNMGKMSKMCVNLRKCRSELKKAVDENDKLRKEDEANKFAIQGLNDTVNKLEADNRDLQAKIQVEKEKNTQATNNARSIIRGLKSGCTKRIEEGLKTQFLSTINEKQDCILKKDKQLRDAEEMVKNVEEENRRLKKELEEAKVEKQRVEDKLKATKLQISPDTISEYKRTHYCCVCERSAAIVCCLDTSYCSSECQKRHAEEHRKHCKSKITSQSIVQQRVISQQSVVMVSHGVITSGRSSSSNQSISKISEPDSITASTHHKKPQIHRVSASPLLPTPHYRSTASSSRSYSSKGKRRR